MDSTDWSRWRTGFGHGQRTGPMSPGGGRGGGNSNRLKVTFLTGKLTARWRTTGSCHEGLSPLADAGRRGVGDFAAGTAQMEGGHLTLLLCGTKVATLP